MTDGTTDGLTEGGVEPVAPVDPAVPEPLDPVQADELLMAQVPTAEGVAAAQVELRQLLDAAGITRVIFVDNEFGLGIDDVVAALLRLPADRRAHVRWLEDIAFEDLAEEEEVWRALVEERWNELSDLERAVCSSDALAHSGIENAREQPNAGAVGPLLPGEATALLSPTEWAARADELLADVAEGSTLLLVDRHFDDEDNQGIELLRAVFERPGFPAQWDPKLGIHVT